ncbi:MAG: hypothetical protein ACKOKC_13565 [Chthoniobacterales bacterium]
MIRNRDATRTMLEPYVTAALSDNCETQALESLGYILTAEVPRQLLVAHPLLT